MFGGPGAGDGFGQTGNFGSAGAGGFGEAAFAPDSAPGYGGHQQGYGGPSQTYGGMSQAVPGFSQPEQEYYGQLFNYVDSDRSGWISGQTAAQFLTTSGVRPDMLHHIWEIADQGQQGGLTIDRFFVACRLTAHAQNGQNPDPQLASVEPRTLPDFQLPGFQRKRAPSETSGGSPAPSNQGNRSDISELQPVIGGGDEQVKQAARKASRSPSPRKAWHRSQWAPSQREKRKYASLFKRTDFDNDGFVQGHEASTLLERSRLPRDVLGIAWEHADVSQTGKLDFRGFVCLVHIVTCVLRGAPMIQQHEPLPPELVGALQTLESPDVLVAEREASRSRSASPAPSGSLAAGLSGMSPGADASGGGDAWGSAKDFGASSFGAEADGGFGGSGGFGDTFGDVSSHDKKEKKKKKDKKDSFGFGGDDSGGWGGGAGDFGGDGGFGGEGTPGGRSFDGGFSAGITEDPFTTHTEGGHARKSKVSSLDYASPELSEASAQFEAVIAADAEVSRHLRDEVDALNLELRGLEGQKGELLVQVQQEQKDEGSLSDQQKQLERQLADVKRRLVDIRDERRAVNLESLSLRSDRNHFSEEVDFLRSMVTDEENTLEVVRRTNQFLEKSFRDLEAHTETLEEQRREVVQEVSFERDSLRQDERQNAELRNRLEQLRRDLANSANARSEAQKHEQKVREMQVQSGGGRGHSWATTLVGGLPGADAVGVDQGRAAAPRGGVQARPGTQSGLGLGAARSRQAMQGV